jgi:hypothetical protein
MSCRRGYRRSFGVDLPKIDLKCVEPCRVYDCEMNCKLQEPKNKFKTMQTRAPGSIERSRRNLACRAQSIPFERALDHSREVDLTS